MRGTEILVMILILLSASTAPAATLPPSADSLTELSNARGNGVTLNPDAGDVVTWHDHTRMEAQYEGESPDITNASAEVTSDLTGVIGDTSLSVVSDTVRISLPERNCDTSDGEHLLCPEGENISVELSGVLDDAGAALPDQSWSFVVGIARISFVSPADGTYLNTTSPEIVFATENHTAQFPGPHIHYMYDEHGASNYKMHKSMDPLQYTGLPEGQHLLILDLRDDSHRWLGHDESIAAITVTVDTIAPSIENEQLAPMVDANNVPINSTVAVRFSEMILEGASITLTSESGEVTGSMTSGTAGSKSELILTPSSNLSEGTLYTVTVDGVKDMADNSMLPYTYSFNTVAGDTEAPTVVTEQLAPIADANNVMVNTSVVVRFSEEILDGATMSLSSEAGAVAGTVTSGMSGSKSELTLTPSADLEEGTLYTVMVDSVSDLVGNQMQAFSYSFTTVGGEDDEGAQNTASGEAEEGWLETWGDLTLGIGVVIASLIGWMFIRKSKAKVRWYLEELDRVVGELGENVSELEQQLDRLKIDVAEDYRKGRLDEKQYQLVDHKLNEASSEMRKQEAGEVLGNIPESLAAKLEQALADGRIDSAEMAQVLSQSEGLDSEQQSGLESMLKRWMDEDEEEI